MASAIVYQSPVPVSQRYPQAYEHSTVPSLLRFALSRAVERPHPSPDLELFCLEDHLFGCHGIVLNTYAVPRELSKQDVDSLYTAIDSCQEFRNASPPIKSVRLLELVLKFNKAPSTPQDMFVVVTTESNVIYAQELLRSYFHPMKVVGSIREHEWMLKSLDIVVATPEEACDLYGAGDISDASIRGLVLLDSDSHQFFEQVLVLLESLVFVLSLPMTLRPPLCRPVKLTKFSYLDSPARHARMSAELRQVIEVKLPEAAHCPGLLDPYFCTASHMFSVFGDNVVCHDWSALVAYMPGLISNDETAVVLAPEYRALQMAELVQAFVEHMGLFGVQVACLLGEDELLPSKGPAIIVGTPDRLCQAIGNNNSFKPRRVVLVETDALLAMGHKQNLSVILGGEAKLTLGVHCSRVRGELAIEVEDIIGSFCRGEVHMIPEAAVTLNGVAHVCVVVAEDEDKLSKVGKVWSELFEDRSRVAVYCNTVSQVEAVTSELRRSRSGFPVVATHTEMPRELVEDVGREFSDGGLLLVTNIYGRGWHDVINFDLPHSPEGYLDRAGVDRNRGSKLVVNMCSKHEVCVLEDFKKELKFTTSWTT